MSNSRPTRTALIIGGVTIVSAIIAWFGNYVAERFENARLITSLQIQREQAETNLRGVIFDQTMKAFLTSDDALEHRSKQLLQLELLSLNFGDTVSLAPLFQEFRRDLIIDEDSLKSREITQTETDVTGEKEIIHMYRKRLRSLAKRVASKQFSSLALQGATTEKKIEMVLATADRGVFENEENQFVWPRDSVFKRFGLKNYEMFDELNKNDEKEFINDILDEERKWECIQLKSDARLIEITISRPSYTDMSASVQLKIWETKSCNDNFDKTDTLPIVDREFKLDFFNFPKIDNTRLPNNERFALILEDFKEQEIDGETQNPIPGKITMAAVIFPSEYASLSDRPGMKEAIMIMEDAMNGN